jgi:hypothetical protein
MSDENDDTNPGDGTGEGYIAASAAARRVIDAIAALERAFVSSGDPSEERSLEVLAHLWGELGDLSHDTRRITIQKKREKFP